MKNSNELLVIASQEVEKAIKSNKAEVKIVLKKSFKGDINAVKKLGEEFKIKKITEILRENFNSYEIKSKLGKETDFIILSYDEDCDSYSLAKLIWTLTLMPKS